MSGAALTATGWDVFVAHAGPDAAVARRFTELLEARGKRVCLDRQALQPGDNWHRLLPEWLAASTMTVALLSDRTPTAWYENDELIFAIQRVREGEHRMVPVKLTPTAPTPYGLHALNAIDAFDDLALVAAADAVVRALDNPTSIPRLARPVWSHRIPRVPKWFTGRETMLGELSAERTVLTQTSTVHGLGGVGKTTLAAAFAERRRAVADIVWWVRAERDSTLIDDLVELADRLGIAKLDDPRDRVHLLATHLAETDRPWLLVFDNAVDEKDVAPWIPRTGGMVMITTRNRSFNRLGHVTEVGVLTPADAETFLRDRVREQNPKAAAEPAAATVAQRLGGLPLALEQAGAWVAASPVNTFARYLRLFDDAAKNPFPDDTIPLGYERTTWDTWQVSIAAATAKAPLAPKALAALAWIAPEGFRITWLTDAAGDPYLTGHATEADDESDEPATDDESEAVLDAVAALNQFSLLATDGESIDIHRIVQAATRRQTDPESGRFAVRMLRRQSPGSAWEVENWAICQLLTPHAEQVHQTEAGLPEEGSKLVYVLNDCASAHQHSGDPLGAVARFETARDLAERYVGDRHPDTLAVRANLGTAYRSAGRIHEAIALDEQVVIDCAEVLGERHPVTLTARASLADSYRTAGRVLEAIDLGERVVADCAETLGERHPITASVRSDLAHSYWSERRIPEAIALQEWVLVYFVDTVGERHPHTLTARANLAGSYWREGRATEAIALEERVLVDSIEVLGDRHPETLRARANLAGSYWSEGRFPEAIALYESVFNGSAEVLGDGHPETLLAMHNLCWSLLDADRLPEARALCERLVGLIDHLPATHELRPAVENLRSALAE